jgi:peptidyl-prolyl cis-trans isomerase A (cyclophilin A)
MRTTRPHRWALSVLVLALGLGGCSKSPGPAAESPKAPSVEPVVSPPPTDAAPTPAGELEAKPAEEEAAFANPAEPAPPDAERPPLPAASAAASSAPAPGPAPVAGPPPSPPSRELLAPGDVDPKAPARFTVRFVTTKGEFVIEVVRAWSPHGVDRFYRLVRLGFFQDIALFRVVKGFVVQFGIHGNPAVTTAWQRKTIKDDPVNQSNQPGYLSFAKAGPATRTTQVFVNLTSNLPLDMQGFSPFAKVVGGMQVFDELYAGYADAITPQQGAITEQGNAFLRKSYPKLDYVISASIVK